MFAYFLVFICSITAISQQLYFPPPGGDQWDTVSAQSLGWNTATVPDLLQFLEQKNTKAFILLKDGKIVIESYAAPFTKDSLWYWASAGKTLTSFMVGMMQQQKMLSIDDPVSLHLGAGWTSCPAEKESLITVRHQLTMTAGLDDNYSDPFCTDDTCLLYRADAGTRWAYHNASYSLLDDVLDGSTSMGFTQFFTLKLRNPIGMNGLWFKSGYNNVYASNARSMARFGLLILNRGTWEDTALLTDTSYFRQMTTTSQQLNKSYGYLWWLNGKSSFMLPQTQLVFPGPLNPDAPSDMFAAMGKNGQMLNIVPGMNLVFVRMGEAPGTNDEMPIVFNNEIWRKLNVIIGITSIQSTAIPQSTRGSLHCGKNIIRLNTVSGSDSRHFTIVTVAGEKMLEGRLEAGATSIDISPLSRGLYCVSVSSGGIVQWSEKFIKR